MPKLAEVIEMFEMFGFSAREVKKWLGAGASAHNAYEGLKILLELRWADMNQELGIDTLRELKPVYEALMALKMTGRKTKKDVKKKRKVAAHVRARDVMRRMEQRKQENVEHFMDCLSGNFREMEEKGKLDDATKERIRALGLGDLWKD